MGQKDVLSGAKLYLPLLPSHLLSATVCTAPCSLLPGQKQREYEMMHFALQELTDLGRRRFGANQHQT
jgi:hypothetical protein